MHSKTKFYDLFTQHLPSNIVTNLSDKDQYDIYFEQFSLLALEEMHNYSTDERLYDYFEYNAFNSIEDTKSYMKKLIDRMSGDKDTRVSTYWLIRRKSDKHLIGTAGLIDFNFIRQSIEWGYGIDPELWGQGYILQIQEILKNYVFDVLELNRIHGVTMITNKRTIESILAAGFQNEGIARDYYCKNDTFIDGWRYAMTKYDYKEQEKSFSKGNQDDIKLDDVISIVSSILPDEDISHKTTMRNTTSWDSLNHMLIILAIKEKLDINLSPSDIAEATSIKRILKIANKIK